MIWLWSGAAPQAGVRTREYVELKRGVVKLKKMFKNNWLNHDPDSMKHAHDLASLC